jgi:hypothetical protein
MINDPVISKPYPQEGLEFSLTLFNSPDRGVFFSGVEVII